IATGKPADGFKLPKQDRHSMSAIAPDDRTFIVSTKDGLLVWDMKEGRELRRISNTESSWFSDWRLIGPFFPDGKSFLTNFDGLQRYELENGRPLLPDTTGLGHTWPVEAIAFSGDGKWLASARDNVRVWNITTRRLMHTLPGRNDDVPKLLFTSDCSRLVATGAHGTVGITDVVSGKQLHLFQLESQRHGGERPRIGALQLSLDGQQVTAAANAFNGGKQVCILGTWNMTNGEELAQRINPYGAGILAWRLQLSKAGELLNRNGDLLSPNGGNSLNP